MMRYLIILLFCLVSCKETPRFENFDSKAWKNDRLGCKGERKKAILSLGLQKEKLKGLGQNQIMQLLGKPDVQELASRNQRTYIYCYLKGHQCQDKQPNLKRDTVLRVRFDALDRVNEITL